MYRCFVKRIFMGVLSNEVFFLYSCGLCSARPFGKYVFFVPGLVEFHFAIGSTVECVHFENARGASSYIWFDTT